MEKLQIFYNDLDDEHQNMFLDIACFLCGVRKNTAIQIWNGDDKSPSL